MKNYRKREYEVFVVSGTLENFRACLETIRASEPDLPPDRIHVFAGWALAGTDLEWQITYHEQLRPFAVARENNRALREIWGRGRDAILVEDDVEVVSPEIFKSLAMFAEAYDGRCLLSPGIEGFIYGNVVLRPHKHLQIHREPKHYPIICSYFPVELELLVGYYDEGYTRYGCDDIDYTLRLVKAGIPLLACSKLITRHRYDRSVFRARGTDQTASREYFRGKWGAYPGDRRLD